MSQPRYRYVNLGDAGTVYRYSCQVAGLPATNVQEPIRLKVWKTESGFHVSPYNKYLPFRDTATGALNAVEVASGTYTGSALASVLESAMDTLGTYTGHSVIYNTATGKFVLTKAPSGSLLEVDFSTATYRIKSLAILLGFVYNTLYSGETNYSSPAATQGNEHEIVLEFAASATVMCLIIDKHNLESGTVLRYRLANTATVFANGWWTSPAGVLRSAHLSHHDTIIAVEHTATVAKALQLHWYDRGQPYSQIGRIWAGVYFTPEYRNDEETDVTWAEKRKLVRTQQTEAEGGAVMVDKRDPVNEWTIEVDPLDPYFNPNTKSGFEDLFNTVGHDVAFYVSFDSTDLNGSTIYGMLTDNIVYERLRNTPVLQVRKITIREQL